jgi:hypothetical protein
LSGIDKRRTKVNVSTGFAIFVKGISYPEVAEELIKHPENVKE